MSLILDDGFPWHPKVVPLSDAAFRVHTTALCHAKRYRTGGIIRRGVESAFHPRRKRLADVVAELVEARLWEEHGNGWVIHDWEDWWNEGVEQAAESREKLDSRRRRGFIQNRADAGRLGGLASAEARRSKFGSAQPKQTEANLEATSKQTLEAKPEANAEAPEAGSRARTSDPDPDPRSFHPVASSPKDLTGSRARRAQSDDDAGSSKQTEANPKQAPEANPEANRDEERETICPADLESRAVAAGIPHEFAEHYRTTDASVIDAVREFAAYWTIGGGAGKRKRHWLRGLRQRLKELGEQGRFKPPGLVEHEQSRPLTAQEQAVLDRAKKWRAEQDAARGQELRDDA